MSSHAHPHIVVGVDGSEGSKEALRWAADQARVAGGRIDVIGAWQYPAMYHGYAVPMAAEIRGDMERLVRGAVTGVLGSEPDIPVTIEIREGAPAQVLITASRTADLLVLGWRGHGAIVGMLLGSVAAHCVHHGECPVLVVRPRAAAPRPAAHH